MAESETLVFRASLTSKIYRDIEIAGTGSLYALAQAIVRSFDFDFDHAFGFYSKLDKGYRTSPEKYEMTADTGGVQQTAVSKAFAKAGKKLLFVFDYDAEWCFEIELVKVAGKKPETRYPRLINSSGDAPEQYPMDED